MANAIKKISVQRGYDVTRYALNCFGGAGGQHACLVADALGMTRVLIHPFSSLLSAYGMGLADIRATRQQAIEQPFGGKALAVLKSIGGKLGKDVKAEVAGQGVPAGKIKTITRAHIRYAGTDTALIVDAGALPKMKARVREGPQSALRLHRSQQADRDRGRVGRGGRRRRALSARRRPRPSAASCPSRRDAPNSSPPANGTRPASSPATSLRAARACTGPAIIIEPHQTIVVEPGWRAEITRQEPSGADARRAAQAHACDRHQGRSGDAGSVQQPLHVDRRADGRVAAEHRLFGEHQGAARFLLRGVRARRHFGRQRAAHAGASRLDGPLGRDHHPRQQGQDPPGRRLSRSTRPTTAAPTCPTSPSARRCSTSQEEDPVLGRLARPSRRRRRHLARLDVAERDDHRAGRRAVRQFQAGRSRPLPREGAERGADRREISGAQPGPEHQRHQGADRRQRERRQRAAQDGRRISRCRWSKPTCSTCRTTPPRACGA